MITAKTIKGFERRMRGHTTVNGIAVCVVTARELQELLEAAAERNELENTLKVERDCNEGKKLCPACKAEAKAAAKANKKS
jgi:transcription elongation GreA/GreB family factor